MVTLAHPGVASLLSLLRSAGFVVLGIACAVTVHAQSTNGVVVVPFTNLSQEASDVWIGVGIAETVASDLQNLGVSVRADFGVDRLDQQGLEPLDDAEARAFGKDAGAQWVVTGAYQRVGDLLRITARLIDVASGNVHQTAKIDGAITDLFHTQDQIVDILGDELIPTRRSGTRMAAQPGAPRTGIRTRPQGRRIEEESAVAEVSGVLELEDAIPGLHNGNGNGVGGAGPQVRPRGSFAAVPVGERPRVAIGRTSQPPSIDGRLDDSVWETATHITDFIQVAPIEGAPGSEDTEVWLAYDSDNLYVGFYAHYTDPGSMRTNRSDRDDMRGDDRMAVLFDPFLDQQRAYQFEVNGYGVQGDSLVNADGTRGGSGGRSMMSSSSRRGSSGPRRRSSGMSNSGLFGIRGDDSWNALFTTAGRIVEDGWTAEMSIPFKSLRYPAAPATVDGYRWGFQITRIIRAKSEAQAWSPISRGVAGQLTQFGVIEGMSDLSQSRNLEFLPEMTGVQVGSLNRDTGYYAEGDAAGEIGVGIKYGITPNLTADFTYNPDYSQIESDRPQIETNQRFALFFPEQRPFFLEGQEIFTTATPLNLLHTRTIVDPRFGGKITGKVGNTTLGVMLADDEAAGRLDDRNDPQFGTTAQTFVGRARYDLYSESYLGTVMTAREFGQDHSRVAGVDGRFRLGQTHRVSFLAVGSSTQNEAEGTLAGPAIEADFVRQGRNLSYSASYSSIDPEFRTDTGFLPRVDFRQATATAGYRWWPESTLITWGPSLTYLRLYDYAGVLQDEQIQATANFSFQKNISFFANANRDLERFSGIEFRKTGYGLFGVISARTLSIVGGYNWGDGVLFSDNPFLGRSSTGNFLISARPTSRLRTELTGIFSRFLEPIGDSEVFAVKIFRTRTTFQFTDRLLMRHIMEHNTQAVTVGNNLLLTYRINAGTVAFLGYDDRYQRGTRIDTLLFSTTELQRTNRAFFGKISYLFRY